MTPPDGPESHPDPLAALEECAAQQLTQAEESYARAGMTLDSARADLNAIRDLRRAEGVPAELIEKAERRRRKAAWAARGQRLGLVAAIGTGLGAALKLVRSSPAAAAVGSSAVTVAITALVLVFVPGLCERDGQASTTPPRPPAADQPTSSPSGTRPPPRSAGPSGPAPGLSPAAPTTQGPPSPVPTGEGDTAIATGEPEPPAESPAEPPGPPGPPAPPPDGNGEDSEDGDSGDEGDQPPAGEPPPTPPERDCLIRVDLGRLADVCVL